MTYPVPPAIIARSWLLSVLFGAGITDVGQGIVTPHESWATDVSVVISVRDFDQEPATPLRFPELQFDIFGRPEPMGRPSTIPWSKMVAIGEVIADATRPFQPFVFAIPGSEYGGSRVLDMMLIRGAVRSSRPEPSGLGRAMMAVRMTYVPIEEG